jgi:urease accessory protein
MDRHPGQVAALAGNPAGNEGDPAGHTLALRPHALLRLLHLASPSLPVGAYSYSQGLESAIDAGIVSHEAGAFTWISDILRYSVARLEAPVFCRLYAAWAVGDMKAVHHWSEFFLASRDTAEFRAETVQMGYSLAKLLAELLPDHALAPALAAASASATRQDLPYPTAMAAAGVMLDIPLEAALHAYLFSWAENQVIAALKGVPLGQMAGQRMLLKLEDAVVEAARTALAIEDDDISNWTPGLSLLSMQHETQYSRIFRS